MWFSVRAFVVTTTTLLFCLYGILVVTDFLLGCIPVRYRDVCYHLESISPEAWLLVFLAVAAASLWGQWQATRDG